MKGNDKSAGEQHNCRLLLIDDEADTWAGPLDQGLRPLRFELSIESRAERALTVIRSRKPDVVLLDLHFPGDDRRRDDRTTGGELLERIRKEFPRLPVVIFTTRLADGDIVLEPFKAQPHGLFDKSQISASKRSGEPWPPKLAWTLRRAIEIASGEQRDDDSDMDFVVGVSESMRRVAAAVRSAARHDLAVLVVGETGTERLEVASTIHRLRACPGTFEQLNCSGLSEDDIRSRVFGPMSPVAMQGPTKGLLDKAKGGTLFLDQIQAMPKVLQRQLLEMIEGQSTSEAGDGEYRPSAVAVKLIVAIKDPLSELVADSLLIEDLAYTLSRCRIELPPLRERLDDIEKLCEYLIGRANRTLGVHILQKVRPEVIAKLKAHSWPGNLRELAAVLERAMLATRANVLSADDVEIAPLPSAGRDVPSADTTMLESGHSGSASQIALEYAFQVEKLPVRERYALVKRLDVQVMRPLVITELVRRLRKAQGRRVMHKDIAYFLDTCEDGQKSYDKIRKLLSEAKIHLTELECNR